MKIKTEKKIERRASFSEGQMKYDELSEITDGFDSYVEVLCKAILLDKVKIVDGKIQVQSWDNY